MPQGYTDSLSLFWGLLEKGPGAREGLQGPLPTLTRGFPLFFFSFLTLTGKILLGWGEKGWGSTISEDLDRPPSSQHKQKYSLVYFLTGDLLKAKLYACVLWP